MDNKEVGYFTKKEITERLLHMDNYRIGYNSFDLTKEGRGKYFLYYYESDCGDHELSLYKINKDRLTTIFEQVEEKYLKNKEN